MRDETNTVTMDGSEGEGGGQMLRSSHGKPKPDVLLPKGSGTCTSIWCARGIRYELGLVLLGRARPR